MAVVSIILLILSILVLYVAIGLSAAHLKSGWLFKSSSLKIPTIGSAGSTENSSGLDVFISLAWRALDDSGAIELLLRQFITLLGGEDRLSPMVSPIDERAEIC